MGCYEELEDDGSDVALDGAADGGADDGARRRLASTGTYTSSEGGVVTYVEEGEDIPVDGESASILSFGIVVLALFALAI